MHRGFRCRALGASFLLATLSAAAASAGGPRLFGVSGDGASPSESLFEISQLDASTMLLAPLGNGVDGEAIVFNPDDGLVYHFSGRGPVEFVNDPVDGSIMSSIDPDSLAITPIPLQGAGFDGSDPGSYSEEVLGVAYDSFNIQFFVCDLDAEFYWVSTGGVVAHIATLDHVAKGMAVSDGNLYTLDNTFGSGASLRIINPVTGATMTMTAVTLPGFTISNGIALAAHPQTDELWAVLKMEDNVPGARALVTIDSGTGVATLVGTPSVSLSSIAFVGDGPAMCGPEDLNGDGRVDGIDLGRLLGAWGDCDGDKKK